MGHTRRIVIQMDRWHTKLVLRKSFKYLYLMQNAGVIRRVNFVDVETLQFVHAGYSRLIE